MYVWPVETSTPFTLFVVVTCTVRNTSSNVLPHRRLTSVRVCGVHVTGRLIDVRGRSWCTVRGAESQVKDAQTIGWAPLASRLTSRYSNSFPNAHVPNTVKPRKQKRLCEAWENFRNKDKVQQCKIIWLHQGVQFSRNTVCRGKLSISLR